MYEEGEYKMKTKKRRKKVVCSTCGEKDHYMCATPAQSLLIFLKITNEHVEDLRKEQADLGLRLYEIRGELTAYIKTTNDFEKLAETLKRYKIK